MMKASSFRILMMSFALVFTLVSGNSFAQQTRVGNTWVEEEVPETFTGVPYINPNEARSYVYRTELSSKKDTLIAVGSFRFWFDLAMGDFSLGVPFDYDPQIKEFHELNIQTIRALAKSELGLSPAEKRNLYLSIVLGRKIQPANPLPGQDPLTVEWDFQQSQLESYFSTESPSTEDLIHFPQQLREYARQFAKFNIGLRSILGLYAHPANQKVLFWASDSLWVKIEKLVLEDRIFPVTGDLLGPKTLVEIGNALKSQGFQISVFDMSNALPLVLSEREQLQANLRALPWVDSSVILFTEDLGGAGLNLLYGDKTKDFENRYSSNCWVYYFLHWPQNSEQQQVLLQLLLPRAWELSLRLTSSFMRNGSKEWLKRDALEINPPGYNFLSPESMSFFGLLNDLLNAGAQPSPEVLEKVRKVLE